MTKISQTFVTTVAFVGMPNVGKSTLLNALVGTKIAPTSRKPQTTRRIIRGIKTVPPYQQIYFDTPGMLKDKSPLDRFMLGQIEQALADVHQIVVLVDAQASSQKYIPYLKSIKELAARNDQPLILVINKIDTLKDKAQLLEQISHYSQELSIDDIVPISAEKREGLDKLFTVLNRAAEEKEFLFNEDLFTDASEKDIVAELIREKCILELKEELPYRLAVTIDNFDESRRENERKPLIEIEAVLHVERPSQKAIVIGKGGENIRTIGIRARKDLEHLLHCQVMLKLFVRVESKWSSSGKAMRKLGLS